MQHRLHEVKSETKVDNKQKRVTTPISKEDHRTRKNTNYFCNKK